MSIQTISYDLIGFANKDPVFFVLGLIIMIMALLSVAARNLVHSALFLLGTFCSIALLYCHTQMYFLAISQVLIYAVGITLIIIFALMLMRNVSESFELEDYSDKSTFLKYCAILISTAFFSLISTVIVASKQPLSILPQIMTSIHEQLNISVPTIKDIGSRLISEQVISFELISFLLLVALVGAIVIARRN